MYNSLSRFLKDNRQEIINLYKITKLYENSVKSFYLKTGMYKGCANVVYNGNLKRFLKYLINKSEVYCCDVYYEKDIFLCHYNKLIKAIKEQTKHLYRLLARDIEQYQ